MYGIGLMNKSQILYYSCLLGRGLCFSDEQIKELVTGLEKSEEKIIWVMRKALSLGVMNTFDNIKCFF